MKKDNPFDNKKCKKRQDDDEDVKYDVDDIDDDNVLYNDNHGKLKQ
jgi:hypothetical protein